MQLLQRSAHLAVVGERCGRVARPTTTSRRRRSTIAAAATAAAARPTEAAAIEAFKAAANGAAGVEQALALLRAAAADRSVAPEVAEGALAFLEAAAPAPAADVAGRWRLVFSTATAFRPFQYIPVDEDFVISELRAGGYCALESAVGPFRFVIRGGVEAWDPATGALAFQFTAVDIFFGGDRRLYTVTPKTKPKTYTFYYGDGGIAAARSSAGGLALLRK